MQTERVTFLTSPDHKAALDAYARESGMSVGHVVREATSQYIAPRASDRETEEALELLLPEAEAAVHAMNEDIAAMRAMIARTRAIIDEVVASDREAA